MNDQWMVRVQAWLQRHAGIVSVEQMADFGCPRREAYRLVERGEFDIVMPGVLRSLHWPLGEQQLKTAAFVRNLNALIAFSTAARQWGFRGVGKDDVVHVLIPHGTSPTMPGVTIHRCRRIDAVDIVARSDGTRLTSPPRTLFDCADVLGRHVTASNLELLLDSRKGTMTTHVTTLTRLAGPTRPGTRTMREVIASRPAWRAAVQSELEHLVLNEIEQQGLPTPVVQLRTVLPGGRTVRFDFAWPELKLALEVDHPFWHAGSLESARDKRRDLLAATVGWQTVRITNLDVTGGLPTRIRDVARIIALR